MKTLVKSLMLAVVVAGAASTSAMAGDTNSQQRLAQRNYEYFNVASAAQPAAKGSTASSTAYTPKVSQYPCGRCVYDSQLGGYVEKPGRK